ncbi:mannosyl-glycoprotein endo-beta-N-acetylglucosamidase [Weissella confusa]|uniref:glycoside hydrolase family 73 protein n=3 Tax=Weissella confusa TaxID=1583 RepID=UPI0018F193E4|nr:glucosaminidase domain-containing protein [Weissella confusa]MBJ7616612.1 mannosyl-glycoprotein endo-beta-N-acetylglucosamidase [Weissella confusa]MCT8392514.1 mannosyl-glycoprotein endo-beta-N-acetylglucosamidase [Weissella confusa]
MKNKKLLVMALVSGSAMFGHASEVDASSQTDFINQLKPSVQEATSSQNLYASLQMAQAILESSWGQSELTRQANNYFGIKGTYNGQFVIMNTAEFDSNGNLYYTDAQFRKYPSAKQSMEDNAYHLRHGVSWNSSIYSGTWRENANNGRDAAWGLVPNYATDPSYANKLINLINTYNLETLDYNSKFKTGAKVQVVNWAEKEANGWNLKDRQNWVGTVKSVKANNASVSHYEYYIDYGNGVRSEHVLEQDLQTAPNPKYSSSAPVQIVNWAEKEANGWNLKDHRGWTGKVQSVAINNASVSHYEYYVTYADGSRNEHVLEQDLTAGTGYKYKVGQQVQIYSGAESEANGWNLKDHRNWLGTIKSVAPVNKSNSKWEYYITYPDGSRNEHVLEQDVVPATPAKYKAGQTVQIYSGAEKEANGWNLKNHQNWIGTIKSVKANNASVSHYEYYIEYPDGSRNEHVLEQDVRAPQSAKFKAGQTVQIYSGAEKEANGWNLKDHQNWIGTIKSVKTNNASVSHYEYYIQYPDGSRNEHVLEQDVRSAQAAKYAVGQRVKVSGVAENETNGYDLRPHRNWVGTVKKVALANHSKSRYAYWIEYDNGERNENVPEQDVLLP